MAVQPIPACCWKCGHLWDDGEQLWYCELGMWLPTKQAACKKQWPRQAAQ